MRIGIDARTLNDHFPGVGRNVFELTRALAASGEEIVMLVDGAARGSRLAVSGIEGVQALAAGSPFGLSAPARARRLARGAGLQVLHAPYLLGVRRPGCPLVLTVHDAIPLSFEASMPNLLKRAAFRTALAASVRHADLVVTPSAASKEEVLRFTGLHADRVRVVPHAAGEQFRPVSAEAATEAASRLGIPGPFVLCLAGPRPHKNLEGLLDAWARLPADLVSGRTLVLVGPEDRRFPEPARRLRAIPRERPVRRIPSVPEDDLPALLSAAEIYVQPSFREGFGLPVIEAMACGTAVACADAPGLRETAGGAAELFDPARPPDIARALGGLMADPAGRRRLAEAGLERAGRLDWKQTAAAMLDIYREAAGRR